MRKTAIFSDTAFVFIAVSLPVLCLLRYYRYSLAVSIIAGVLLAASVSALFLAFSKRKNGKFVLKKREETELEETLFHLALLPQKKAAELFFAAYLKKDETATIKRYGKTYAVEQGDCITFPAFEFEYISSERLLSIYRLRTAKRKKILVNGLTESAKALAKRLNLSIVERQEVFALLKETETLPDLSYAQKPRPKMEKYKIFVLKSNAKTFFTCGALVLGASLLTPFPYYYLVFGGTMMLVALLLRFFGKEAG